MKGMLENRGLFFFNTNNQKNKKLYCRTVELSHKQILELKKIRLIMQQNILKIDFKNIHIGSLILKRVTELNIEIDRICSFLKCSEIEIQQMYEAQSLDTEILLRWSKLLEYDFFRIYNQHLILFAPHGNTIHNHTLNEKKSVLPQFKKNIYMREVIDFILDEINQGEMTKMQVIKEYRIPKTTLYKWLEKYNLDRNKK